MLRIYLLLGGGPTEMFCAFLGAGAGNYLRAKMNQHHLTLFLCTAASVALACVVYTISFMALKSGFDVSIHHQAGYICSMLLLFQDSHLSQVALTLRN